MLLLRVEVTGQLPQCESWAFYFTFDGLINAFALQPVLEPHLQYSKQQKFCHAAKRNTYQDLTDYNCFTAGIKIIPHDLTDLHTQNLVLQQQFQHSIALTDFKKKNSFTARFTTIFPDLTDITNKKSLQ